MQEDAKKEYLKTNLGFFSNNARVFFHTCFLLQIIKQMSAEGLSVHSQRNHKQRETHYAAQLHRTLSCDIRITSATLLFALNGIKGGKKKKKKALVG